MKVISTQEYFNMGIDDLLATDENTYTKEEKLLFDDGIKVTFFDSEKEFEQEKNDFEEWYKEDKLEVKAIVKTINERVAVILI